MYGSTRKGVPVTESMTEEGHTGLSTPMIPVILNGSLAKPCFTDYLGSGFKVRVSHATPRDSVILPRCGVAILLVYLSHISSVPSSNATNGTKSNVGVALPLRHSASEVQDECGLQLEEETIDQLVVRMENFLRRHQVGVVVVVGSVFGEEEVGRVIGQLQTRLLPRPPLILLAHGEAQAAAHVQVLAKATQPEMRRVVEERMSDMIAATLNKEMNITLVRAMGLNYHQASVLVDTFGNIGDVAAASSEDIHRLTPLDAPTAAAVTNFLAKDVISL